MTYVLDTDTFSDATFRARGLRVRIDRERESHDVVVSVITRLESFSGWLRAMESAADLGKLQWAVAGLQASEEFLTQFLVLPFDVRAGEHFERLRRDKQAKKAGRKDLLIGCIAIAHSATVVTRNRKHFGLIPDLPSKTGPCEEHDDEAPIPQTSRTRRRPVRGITGCRVRRTSRDGAGGVSGTPAHRGVRRGGERDPGGELLSGGPGCVGVHLARRRTSYRLRGKSGRSTHVSSPDLKLANRAD
jgi:tRNA(fMet)-specific endonuclease VapC